MQTSEFLMGLRDIIKLYEVSLKEVCEKFELSMIETTIITFLYHNPDKDTAGDIVEYRNLSKGNVSQAVESLIQKSLLQRIPDQYDRRKIHLSLLDNAKPITTSIERVYHQFSKDLFNSFSSEELLQIKKINDLMKENTKKAMQRRIKNER